MEAERGHETVKTPASPTVHGDCPVKTPPKSALPMCGFLGVLFLLELLVFTADLLRTPFEFSYLSTDYPTWKFPDFFSLLVSQKLQKHWIFGFL